MTVSTLPLVPGTSTVPGAGASAQPNTWPWVTNTTLPGPGQDGSVHGHSARTQATALERGASDDYPEWLHHVQGAAACKHPIRLAGKIHVNDGDGQRMASFDTVDMPDGTIYTPCGNRRANVCPACADLYRRDTYHLIKAGLVGDRWGLPPLHEHIAVFVTATAPSFGLVHHRVVEVHAADCRRKDRCTCRPKRCQPFGRPCPHGQPRQCTTRHKVGDPALGQPLCLDCYDHHGQVVWNMHARELWRRTIQEVDREVRRLGHRNGVELRRRYVKVYEFQVRGVVHYHALIRLDGYHPDCPAAVVPAAGNITRAAFEDAIRTAFAKTACVSAPHPANNDRGWPIAWGGQLDIQHVNAPGGAVSVNQVAGYIAKYTTKGTETTGLNLRRVDDITIDAHGDPATHVGRLLRACWNLGAHPSYTRLRRYAHQYGYGGHIVTKSRGFSITRAFQRLQRTIWRRTEGHPTTWDDETTARIIYELGYHATGWITTGDALLANTAAAQARERHQAGRDALTDADTPATTTHPVAA